MDFVLYENFDMIFSYLKTFLHIKGMNLPPVRAWQFFYRYLCFWYYGKVPCNYLLPLWVK